MTTIAPEQLTLNLTPLREPIYETGMTLAERFEAFHAANPHNPDGTITVTTAGGDTYTFLDLTDQWYYDHDHGIRVSTIDALAELCGSPGEFVQGWVPYRGAPGLIESVTVEHDGSWMGDGLAFVDVAPAARQEDGR